MEGSSFVLCRSLGSQGAGTSGRILGSTCGCSNVEVLVTVQGDGVVAYNSSKQQRTRSWPLGSGLSTLVVPAVWDRQTSRYYAALGSPSGEHQLVAWEKEQDVASLAEFKKEALSGAAHSLWPVSHQNLKGEFSSGAIVVFQDGTLAAVAEDLSRTCELRASERWTVEAVAFMSESGAPLLAIVERAVGKRRARIVVLRGEGGSDKFEERRVVELGQSKGSTVVSVALGGSSQLSVLWSDGRWHCYAEEDLTHERTLAIFQQEDAVAKRKKSGKKKRANEEREEVGGEFSGRLIALPWTHYVVAVGADASSKGALVALVLDTQFGCLHRKITLAGGSDEDRKSDSLSALLDTAQESVVSLQLGGEEGQLLVSTSDRVVVCDLALPPLSLANMLGALAPTPAVTSASAPGGAPSSFGWNGTAVEAAATVSGVYKQTEMEALRAPASGVILTPSISGRNEESAETSLIHREEDGVWVTESLTRLGKAEANVLKKMQELKSEQEVVSLLLQHLSRKPAEVSGPNGGLDRLTSPIGPTRNGHANGREDSDGSGMEDALPNGVPHGNGVPKKSGKKGALEKPRRFSRLLRKCSPPLLSAIIEYCLHSEFWSLLEAVLWSNDLSAVSVAPLLLRALAEAQQLRLLETAMPQFRDLAPADLAFLLHFLIKTADSSALQQQAADRKQRALRKLDKLAGMVREGQLSKARQKEVTAVNLVADGVDLFDPRAAALHPLVAAPRDETVLAAALRELDAAEVSFLSAYLTTWMDIYLNRSESSAPKWGTIVLPSLAQVVLWLSVLLDVHLTRLALLPECHHILSRLHKVVSAQIIIARKLVALGGVTSHIQSKAKLPPRRAPSGKPAQGYSVEVLSLG